MLRLKDTIRLTPAEKKVFASIAVDNSSAPTSAQEHNKRLDQAAKVWADGESPEEKLVAALALDLKI